MKRTFFNVGQGLFAVEEFNGKNKEEEKIKTFTMVYDCGTVTRSVKKNGFNNFYSQIRDKGIDVLFISHLHEDHINMISDLLNNKNQKKTKIYLPCLEEEEIIFDSIFEFLEDDLDDINIESLKSKIEMKSKFLNREDVIRIKKNKEEKFNNESKIDLNGDSNSNYFKKWAFIPFFIENPNVVKLLEDLNTTFSEFFSIPLDKVKLLNFIKNNFTTQNKKKIKEIYLKHFLKKNHNFYSMIVYSGPIDDSKFYLQHKINKNLNLEKIGCLYTGNFDLRYKIYKKVNSKKVGCLYTGDFDFKNILPQKIKQYYGKLYDNIGVFQSPHHGSKYNHNIDLYNKNSISIICYGIGPKTHNHPDKCVIFSLRRRVRYIIHINENLGAYSQCIRKK